MDPFFVPWGTPQIRLLGLEVAHHCLSTWQRCVGKSTSQSPGTCRLKSEQTTNLEEGNWSLLLCDVDEMLDEDVANQCSRWVVDYTDDDDGNKDVVNQCSRWMADYTDDDGSAGERRGRRYDYYVLGRRVEVTST